MAPVNIIGFVLVAAIAAFLSFLRYFEFSVRRRQQKRLAELAGLPSPRCGAVFGAEAANAACEEGERRTAELLIDAQGTELA
jgi:hypothetical protein